MAGLTLVSGGPGAGKTARLVEVAAQRYEVDRFASCVVLAPTARHADQFRRRLVLRTGVAFGLDVTIFALFARRYVAHSALASVEVARELLDRVVVERARGDGAAQRFAPIAGTAGLTQLVASAVGDLVADAIEPRTFAEAAAGSGDPDLAALAEIFEAYRAALDERGWADPRELMRLAARAVREGDPHLGAALPPLVLVDGVQFLRAGEVELLAALAAHTDVWVALDPAAGARAEWTRDSLLEAAPAVVEVLAGGGPGVREVEAATAADDEAQLREIARSIKERLTSDGALRPSDFAVVFRRVTPHLALARRVFREVQLPLDPAAGERLAERPFGAWLLRLLRTGVHDWRMRDVADSLSAGFTDWSRWGLRGGDLEIARRVARRHQLWSGLERLRTLPEAVEPDIEGEWPPRDPQRWRDAAAAWTRAVDALAPVLDPAAERTPGEHARLLGEALFGAAGWVRDVVEDYPTLEDETGVLSRELASMRAVDERLGAEAVRFDAFVAALAARMQRPSTLIREAGGVLLAPMHTLHGLRFAHVYLAGLSEGEFPAPPRAAALLDRPRRAALAAAGLDLPPEPRATEHELWQAATTRAEQRLSLWRPRLSGNRPVSASYYFEAAGAEAVRIEPAVPPERAASTRELAVAITRGWPDERRRPAAFPAWDAVVRVAPAVEQRRRSFGTAGAHEGHVPGVDIDWLVAPEVAWSPSRLESYQTCGFQFFGGYALGLREIDEENVQADAATRGTVMHEMLDEAIALLVARGEPLVGATAPEVIERLRTVGREHWDRAPEKESFGRAALWRYEGAVALDQLEALVWREAAHNEALGITSIVGGEEAFSAGLAGAEPPMIVAGRADRVDAGPGLIQIVDYKTGRPIEKNHVVDGQRLQLQLYALAARERFGDVRLVARYAFLRPPRREWTLDSSNAGDLDVLDTAATVSAGVRTAVQGGRFEVSPQVTPCPTYCAFLHVCRVNSFSRLKTWT